MVDLLFRVVSALTSVLVLDSNYHTEAASGQQSADELIR